MTGLARYHRLAWIAFAAICASMMGDREASAATSRGDCSKKMGSGCCCLARPASSPCKPAARFTNLPVPARQGVIADVASIVDARRPACECGADEPRQPASKPEPGSSRTDDRGRLGPLADFSSMVDDDRSVRPGAILLSGPTRLARFSLHLRLCRLLI